MSRSPNCWLSTMLQPRSASRPETAATMPGPVGAGQGQHIFVQRSHSCARWGRAASWRDGAAQGRVSPSLRPVRRVLRPPGRPRGSASRPVPLPMSSLRARFGVSFALHAAARARGLGGRPGPRGLHDRERRGGEDGGNGRPAKVDGIPTTAGHAQAEAGRGDDRAPRVPAARPRQGGRGRVGGRQARRPARAGHRPARRARTMDKMRADVRLRPGWPTSTGFLVAYPNGFMTTLERRRLLRRRRRSATWTTSAS